MAGTARLRDALAQRPSDAVLVCGGGATGVELAFELAQSGKRVTLASTGPVAASLGSEASAYVERSLAARGVVVKQGRVGRFEAGRARFDDGEEVACDWLVWAGGFAVSPLARAAGLDVDARGRVRVDATQRSLSHPMVWAAGDAASMACRTDVRMGCATAMPQGAHAGESVAREMLGLPATPLRYGYSVSCLSLGTDDGVFVRLHADGSPTGRPITGRAGRLLKESVMRYTRVGLQLERRFPGAYWWSAGAKTPVGIG
jgi:NADH dehydrogenase FAD-containing subunit